MPRSSRHKSSKVRSKDVKEYSELEKEERSARASEELSSGDKRKLYLNDAKQSYGAGHGEHMEEYGSLKRRREKGDDGATDRWNGGGDHDRGDKVVVVGNGEVGNESAGKEGRHRESSRKEAREGGAERENKGRERRHERVVNTDGHRLAKQDVENNVSVEDMLLSSRSESRIDGSIRKRRAGSDDGNKQRDGTGDLNERSSKDSSEKDARQKSERLKDDKHKEKYRDDFNKESKDRDDKQRDNGLSKNHVSSRFDEKRFKDEKDVDIQNRKSKSLESDRDQDHDHVDYDRSNIEDRSGKYRRSREKKRSPED